MEEFVKKCVTCGSNDQQSPGVMMTIKCNDDQLRFVHGGECMAKHMLSDLSISTNEEKESAKRFLGAIHRE